MNEPLIAVRVVSMRAEALDVVSLELQAENGAPLPSADPGSHIDLHLPNGLVRNYSLCDTRASTQRYRIGVGRSATSRGGSAFVHERLRVGDVLRISPPRNNFALVSDSQRVVLVAGGIGITPLIAMARRCAAEGREWTLHYCARSRLRTAFLDELRALADGPTCVQTWLAEEDGKGFDAAATFAGTPPPGLHVYCCGPEPLMNAVERATTHFASGQVHFERFGAPVLEAAVPVASGVDLHLKRSGLTLQVPPELSVLECLESHGVSVPFSCREGLCGTCETSVIDGMVDHRDFVLSAADRAAQRKMMVCVSRAAGAHLTLDL